MDSLPTGPELPGESPLQRNDQTLLGLAEELVQFANALHDHCAELRVQKAYSSLYDVLACSQQLVHGLPFFQPVRAEIEGPLPLVRHVPSLETVRSLYNEGQTEKAYAELEAVLDELTDLLRIFTFEKPALVDEAIDE